MARIRTIKPDFWTDERLVECSMAARLFFIGMLNFADDNGNLQRSAKKLKMQIFPGDNIDCEKLIGELIAQRIIGEYSANGDKFLNIRNFLKHQVIDRPSKSNIPPNSNPVDNTSLDEHSTTEGKGREGKGREIEGKGMDIAAASRRKQIPENFCPDETGIAKANDSKIPVAEELERFKDFHRGKGNTMLDWQAAWRTWVSNAAKFSKGKSNGYVNERDASRQRAYKQLTGKSGSAIEGVSTRID